MMYLEAVKLRQWPKDRQVSRRQDCRTCKFPAAREKVQSRGLLQVSKSKRKAFPEAYVKKRKESTIEE